MGRTKAAVLPLPVMAQARRSRPSMAGRDGLLLDRGRAREAELAHSLEQVGVEAEAGKRHEKGLLARPAQEMSWNGDRR